MNFPALELFRQNAVGEIVFRNNQEARVHFVKTVNNAGAMLASRRRELANVMQQRVDERP
jgi:hypothetical protein